MRNAKLLALTLERFKSFRDRTRVELAPLTVILGRNNSGKSTLIQSLLLLKQTLAEPRPDVMVRLDGVVEAFNLRELTHGWPAAADTVAGPVIELEWECDVDVKEALTQPRPPDLTNLAKHSGLAWLGDPPDRKVLVTSLRLCLAETGGVARVSQLELRSHAAGQPDTTLDLASTAGRWTCRFNGEAARKLEVEFDHFVPYLSLDRSAVGPRDRQRAWHNAYLVLFAQPLEVLKRLLGDMGYLGSSRQPPPSLFRAASTAPSDVGANGELAAQLLHRRQSQVVHFIEPLRVSEQTASAGSDVFAQPLGEAVNRVLRALSVTASLRVEEIHDLGFRLLFGEASLTHVGRGLGYLLPLIELGLIADPLRFSGEPGVERLEDYAQRCAAFAHVAIEEPEAHLHPKVASRLAHWLVSLAMANRRLLVETHSDHLVRRLRGLAARAGRASALERWLLDNVAVLSVEQDDTGCSTVTTSRLTAAGGVAEAWPADFMDEASDEESAIYYAKLDKERRPVAGGGSVQFVDEPEPEADEAP